MNYSVVVAGVMALSLSACSAENSDAKSDEVGQAALAATPHKDQFVNSLVDRFDVPSCLDAVLRYAGRKSEAQSVFHERRFDAPDQCVNDLQIAAKRLGFEEKQHGVWSGEITSGTRERVKFLSEEELRAGNLVWEVDVT